MGKLGGKRLVWGKTVDELGEKLRRWGKLLVTWGKKLAKLMENLNGREKTEQSEGKPGEKGRQL
ncbi:MAG: hypothetical protein ACPLKZ_01625 [Candidatus Bathyarchaeales archaeon]